MFNYEAMLKRAVSFFPRWMDIRKRYKTATGAKVIESYIDESKNIEQALIDYKKYYFLDTYEGHEDSVVAFAYRGNIGNVEDLKSITISNISIEITDNIDLFLNQTDLAYYEKGYIYLRVEYCEENNIYDIDYEINDYKSNTNLSLFHIWNIFDEFACFVNMQRQENETNSQLVKRILYHNKNLPNSTEEGLKHAIVSELLTIDNSINVDDIKIERLTPENLRKPYKNFNSLLDHLNEINRDNLKDKIWDIDDWTNEFKTLDYVEHMWDITLDKYTDGIGSSDDLLVTIADASVITDVEIDMYKKSEERLNVYVHNKEIPKKINVKFKKYNNILKSSEARYKIKATEAMDITKSDILLTAYDESHKTEVRKIQDIYKTASSIATVDNSIISDNFTYRLEFNPDSLDFDMSINKCQVTYKNKNTGKIEKTINLIRQSPGFMINAEGALVSTSIKKKVSSITDLSTSKNLIDTYNGISLSNGATQGNATLDVSRFAMNYITINSNCDYVAIPKSLIKTNHNTTWDKETIIFRNDTVGEKTFEINIKANEIKFDVLDNCIMQLFTTINDEHEIVEFVGPGTFTTPKFDSPVEMRIKAVSVLNNKVRITNFLYNSYEINLKLNKGSMMSMPDGQLILPNQSKNTLNITLNTYCSAQPYISGILLGNDFTKIKYLTEVIKPITGCDRIFDISCNASIRLHKTNEYGNVESTIENYKPTISYKALSDNAFIRLNLEEYSSIDRIITSVGKTEIFEQDGKMFYQVSLKNGETITDVTISGYRSISVKEFSLIDMIKVYIPNFDDVTDKIYANRITKGIIVQKNGVSSYSTVLELNSDLFNGVSAQKYSFTKLPSDLSVSFKTTEDSYIYNDTHSGSFISINIYPKKSEEYVAINDSQLLVPEMSSINIVENFNPKLPENELMVYTVEPMTKKDNFDIRFHDWNERIDFTELKNWSIGKKLIAIKSNIDLNNSENFDMDIKEIEIDTTLKQHIEIENNYVDNQGGIIIPSKYILTPPPEASIEYKTFSGIQSNDYDLIKYEEFIIESDGFNKLEYSNINKILHLSFRPYEGEDEISIHDVTILKKEGIIIWNRKSLSNSGLKVYIRYAIDKPMFIKFDMDYIYKEIGYDVEAYRKIDSVKLTSLKNDQKIDLKQISSYNNSDLIFAKCSTPGFETNVSEDKLLIKKMSVENSILVKTGYYYKNGREFYLFTETDKLKLDSVDHIDYNDVDKSGGELTFVKKTNNYIMNSEMRLKGVGEICNINHKFLDIKGISMANKLTACQDFNNWNTFNMNIYIDKGINGPSLNFVPIHNYGYAFIEITDKLSIKSYISLYAEKNLKVYIGKEKQNFGIDFKRSLNIEIESELNNQVSTLIRQTKIDKEENCKYYLIIKGNGILDDIIISEKEIDAIESHVKNIDKLNLSIKESANNGFRYRITINDNKGINNNGASLDSLGNIVNTSLFDWGVTSLLNLTDKKEFLTCEYDNIHIEEGHLMTSDKDGYITTPAIFITSPITVKRLFYKINNIDFLEMKDFKVTILTSPTVDGDFVPVSYHTDNIGYSYGDYLAKYVKLHIEIPKNKVIDNITVLAEYKSTNEDAPKAFTVSNGYLESKIYDAQHSAKYRVKNIELKDISNIKDISISIRAAKSKYSANVWLPYQTINIDETGKITGPDIIFTDARFFQIKVQLKTKDAFVNIKNIELEVI